jgi:aminomethyltransferase
MSSSLETTPLTDWHRSHSARMAPFAGYEMPVHYGSILAEHHACRKGAATFDVSHMGRLRFEGERAGELLDHLLTRQASNMKPGQIRYGLICNAEGCVLDDVLTYRLSTPAGADYYLMVVNASNKGKILKWIEPHLADFPDVALTDRTSLTGMIAIQGPRAIAIAAPLLKSQPERLKRYQAHFTEQFGKPVIVSRTGYTGEDGLEIIVRAEDTRRVWENLLLAGPSSIQPAGLGARDTLRLEAGMPLYGHELTDQINPLSARLDFAVDRRDSYIGADAMEAIRAGGATSLRVGLRLVGPRPAREGSKVLDEHAGTIGWVSSGTLSPTLGYPIAMGYVDARFAGLGSQVKVDIRGQIADAKVVNLPFYSRG